MVTFKVLDILTRNEVDLLVPLAVERRHLDELRPLGFFDFGKEWDEVLHGRR
jgi:hypothetical protein